MVLERNVYGPNRRLGRTQKKRRIVACSVRRREKTTVRQDGLPVPSRKLLTREQLLRYPIPKHIR